MADQESSKADASSENQEKNAETGTASTTKSPKMNDEPKTSPVCDDELDELLESE